MERELTKLCRINASEMGYMFGVNKFQTAENYFAQKYYYDQYEKFVSPAVANGQIQEKRAITYLSTFLSDLIFRRFFAIHDDDCKHPHSSNIKSEWKKPDVILHSFQPIACSPDAMVRYTKNFTSMYSGACSKVVTIGVETKVPLRDDNIPKKVEDIPMSHYLQVQTGLAITECDMWVLFYYDYNCNEYTNESQLYFIFPDKDRQEDIIHYSNIAITNLEKNIDPHIIAGLCEKKFNFDITNYVEHIAVKYTKDPPLLPLPSLESLVCRSSSYQL